MISVDGPSMTMRTHNLMHIALIFSVGGLTAGAMGLLAGCFGNECDQSELSTKANGGHLIDPNMWESSSEGENWIEYNGQRVINFNTDLLGKRVPSNFSVFISADPKGDKFTPAGGNVVNIFNVRPGNVSLQNNTCAQYYVRLVVQAAPIVALDGGSDGNTPLDTDAGRDATARDDAGDASPQ
jgi:hypothetical protein